MQQLDSILKEDRVFPPSDEFRQQANIGNDEQYRQLWKFADEDYLHYWADLARELISWKKTVYDYF